MEVESIMQLLQTYSGAGQSQDSETGSHPRAQSFEAMKRAVENEMNTNIFMLVHGTESSVFNIFSSASKVTWATAKELMDFFRNIDADEEEGEPYPRVDIVLHTDGGELNATNIIVETMLKYPSPIHVWIPYKAMSAGTAIAMAATEIHLSPGAFMGQVDPQYFYGISAQDLASLEHVSNSWLGDLFTLCRNSAAKVVTNWKELIDKIGKHQKWNESQMARIHEELVDGKYHHGKPLFCDDLEDVLPNLVDPGMMDDSHCDAMISFCSLFIAFETKNSKVKY
jgi:ATP-dependent protease ClpP protease subunit